MRTQRTINDHDDELVAMRPVRGSDLHSHDIKLAELATLCDFDSVLRDMLLARMIFESIQRPMAA